jgi:V-type H+-transporting ATPase subunit C
LASQVDNVMNQGRKEGQTFRKFTYDMQKYQEDLKQKTVLETSYEQQKHQLASRCFYAFSELFIALMHLKVMRAFIDGVLRFGIPPRFYIGIVRPAKGQEK